MVITSWLDHIFVLNRCNAQVEFLKIMPKLKNNVSDHLPLKLIYNLTLDDKQKHVVNDDSHKIKEINWLDPFLNEYYKKEISKSHEQIEKLKKEHAACKDEEMKSILASQLYTLISSTLINANNSTLAYKQILKQQESKIKRSMFKKKKKWWNERLYQLHRFKCVKYINYRDSNWKDDLRDPYLKAKIEFEQYQKFAEKERANKKFKQLNDLFGSNVNGFWREVKKMTMIKQMINIPIDEIRKQYNVLFNTSNFPDEEKNKSDEEKLEKLISDYKKTKTKSDYVKIDEENVRKVIKNLKNGKSVGFSGVSNEMLKNGNTNVINSTITYLMEWMINTATIPKLFNISILKPLIKDQAKGSNQLSNLRPLSISDLFTHIFEKLILIEVRIDHIDHKKQFGFKSNASCSHATFILKEILNYNRFRNKTTYIIAIDASKAFDRVSRTKLWITMFEMGIRPVLIIALRAYYMNFYIIVNNGRDYASPFITTYGVKQGGCISPELYKLYSEIIAVLISSLNLGAEYGRMKIDVLMYADDVVIIATCPKEAQLMLDEVSKVSVTHEIKFNPDKNKSNNI